MDGAAPNMPIRTDLLNPNKCREANCRLTRDDCTGSGAHHQIPRLLRDLCDEQLPRRTARIHTESTDVHIDELDNSVNRPAGVAANYPPPFPPVSPGTSAEFLRQTPARPGAELPSTVGPTATAGPGATTPHDGRTSTNLILMVWLSPNERTRFVTMKKPQSTGRLTQR